MKSKAQATAAPHDAREYRGFYWPLALTGLVTLLAQQLQNATLARYPHAAYELATFALAAGIFHLFDAALIFTPQLVNVLARSRAAARLCLKFILLVSGAMTLMVAFLAVPAVGRPVLGSLFQLEGAQLDSVVLYLALLAPNIVMMGLRHYYTGLIVQARRTGLITMLNVLHLAVIWIFLVAGRKAGFGAIMTVAIAQLAASVIHLAGAKLVAGRAADPDFGGSPYRLTTREIFAFFWPVALTSLMFSLSRPILYLFLARLPDPAPVLAAMRVGFDCAMIFHNLLNQFRHLFATFGSEDLAGVRRFMVRVTGWVLAVMVATAFSPAAEWVLRVLIGVEGEVLLYSRHVLMVMCLLPAMIAWRNYYHGLAIINRKTGPMGLGAIMRNLATYAMAATLYAAGWLNHVTAAAILVVGFLAETLTMIYWQSFSRRVRLALACLPWPAAGGEGED